MVKIFIDNYTFLMLFLILINLSQRKIKNSNKKRTAVLFIAVLSLVLYFALTMIYISKLHDIYALAALLFVILLGVIFRKKVWPFKLHCAECKKKLPYNYVIGHDDNLCLECYEKHHPEEKERREQKEREIQRKSNPSLMQEEFMKVSKVDEINWDIWEPTDRCVIVFTEKDNKLLFIEKKKGLGSGYYNAPGGHIELVETAYEAAIRETKEETGIDIKNPEYRGTLYFQFKDKDIRELGYIYYSCEAEGELVECDEARPFWVDKDKIPYENMWKDDILWLGSILEGKKVEAYFLLDDKELIDSKVNIIEEEEC